MSLSLFPKEELLHESSYSTRFLFWGVSETFHLTNHRVALSSSQFGSEGHVYIPLENIDSMEEGKRSSKLWMLLLMLSIPFGLLGFPVILLFPPLGILMMLTPLGPLLFWWLSRREGLGIKSRNAEILLAKAALTGFSNPAQMLGLVWESRIARMHALYGYSGDITTVEVADSQGGGEPPSIAG